MAVQRPRIHRAARRVLPGHGPIRKVCSGSHLVHVRCGRPHRGKVPMCQRIGCDPAPLKVIRRSTQGRWESAFTRCLFVCWNNRSILNIKLNWLQATTSKSSNIRQWKWNVAWLWPFAQFPPETSPPSISPSSQRIRFGKWEQPWAKFLRPSQVRRFNGTDWFQSSVARGAAPSKRLCRLRSTSIGSEEQRYSIETPNERYGLAFAWQQQSQGTPPPK